MTAESRLRFAALPLSRHELDRDYLSRSRPELFDELWKDPAARVLVLRKGKALLDGPASLALLPTASAPRAQLLLYLGHSLAEDTVGAPMIAAVVDEAAAAALSEDPDDWGDLRTLSTRLSDFHAGLFTAALALANWHRSHRFNPATGAPTVPELGGWVLRSADGGEVFPRTDPAIIVGIVDAEDRILLGSNANWDSNRYSLLAGFVEPGESLENAVKREVFEESGIRVKDPVYLGSQPWPFPASIMIGFTATVDEEAESVLTPDGAEIMDLRWFSREELDAALTEIALPGHSSIARAILEHWYGGPIDDSVAW